jgi:hypothetical protein
MIMLTVGMNHVIPLAAMIVAILITLLIAGVSVFVSELIIYELASTKFTTTLKLKSVLIPQDFANSVFAVAAVANYKQSR